MKQIISLLGLFLVMSVSSAQNAVTISVNMSNQSISPDGVHIAGSFQGWDPSSTPMEDIGLGIYSITIDVADNTEIQFKFINGIDWPFQESVPQACGINDGFGGNNRNFMVSAGNTDYGVVCFGECADCGIVVEPETVLVLFQVNMSNENVSPQGVHLAGNFQGWNPNATVLTDLGGGNFEILYEVPANQTAEFRFINGSEWQNSEIVPQECGTENGFGELNRTLEVGSENMVVGPICFGECSNCQPIVPVMIVFQVDMTNETVSPDGVFVAGDFNGWDAGATSLAPNGDGTFQAVAFVNSGSTINYKFINGNDWNGAETVPSDCGINDGSGNINRQIVVGNDPITTALVCFSSCASCEFIPSVEVTFVVDMTLQSVSPLGVHIAGSFNNFSSVATPMTPIGNGTYSATVTVGENEQLFYKFINGNDFSGVESVPFECGQNDGFGGYNRSVVTNSSNFTVNTVCFGSCDACILDVAQVSKDTFSIYPNPAEHQFRIKGAGTIDLVVMDALGNIVIAQRYNENQIIDIDHLSKGVYSIRSSSGEYVGSFVKR